MRTRNKKTKHPDCILTADWHIRATKPECRLDNFIEAMWAKVEAVFNLAKIYQCPILLAGDIGEHHQWPNWLLRHFGYLVNKYQVSIISIPGQHDLPEHSLKLKPKSAYGVLLEGGHIQEAFSDNRWNLKDCREPILPFPFGTEIKSISTNDTIANDTIAMTHQMVIEDKPEWPGQVASSAKSLLKKFPEYKLILSGDNHKPFVVKYKNRLLVNPGSLMRQTAAQVNHKPRVYLWFAETNEVEPFYLPIDKEAVDRTHIDGFLAPQQQDKRITAYVDRLDQSYEISLSYKGNLEKNIETNQPPEPVQRRIWWAARKG